jgi:hypothetical protein
MSHTTDFNFSNQSELVLNDGSVEIAYDDSDEVLRLKQLDKYNAFINLAGGASTSWPNHLYTNLLDSTYQGDTSSNLVGPKDGAQINDWGWKFSTMIYLKVGIGEYSHAWVCAYKREQG